MKSKQLIAKSIASYIKGFPSSTQVVLKKMYTTIQKAAPKAEERIAYGIPTFTMKENLVHFGGYAKHIGFYPGSQAIVVFKKDLAQYKTTKGAIRFPLDQPIPFDLVTKITKFRVLQSVEVQKKPSKKAVIKNKK